MQLNESLLENSDPLRTAQGQLTLRALRLTPAMMNLYNAGDFTPERFVVASVIILFCIAKTRIIVLGQRYLPLSPVGNAGVDLVFALITNVATFI